MKSPFTNMGMEELEKKVADLRMQTMKLNSELASKSAGKNVGQLSKIKKSIAQAKTVMSMLKKKAAEEKEGGEPKAE
ncbi:MAG: 50S ribosomal protein L29 [archaeon]